VEAIVSFIFKRQNYQFLQAKNRLLKTQLKKKCQNICKKYILVASDLAIFIIFVTLKKGNHLNKPGDCNKSVHVDLNLCKHFYN